MTAVEICVDSVAGAVLAETAGADRVELCAGLAEGGTTPSIGTVERVLASVDRIGVQVLVRPRGGDFVYSRDEAAVMLADIAALRALEAAVPVGFVIGALTVDGEIDRGLTAELVAAAAGAPVTFHKAFDATRDLHRSLDELRELGVDRVLTSGGRARAVDAVAEISALVAAAGEVSILAGGGVRAHNVAELVAATGVREVHLRAARTRPSPVRFRRPEVDFSGTVPPDDVRVETSAEEIGAVLSALQTPAAR
jgi:copper homeostasis protein